MRKTIIAPVFRSLVVLSVTFYTIFLIARAFSTRSTECAFSASYCFFPIEQHFAFGAHFGFTISHSLLLLLLLLLLLCSYFCSRSRSSSRYCFHHTTTFTFIHNLSSNSNNSLRAKLLAENCCCRNWSTIEFYHYES